MMQNSYHEITKTMKNLPLVIYLHKKSPIQIIEAHWHRAIELSIVFENEVDFYNGENHEVIKKNEVNLTNSEEIHYSIPHFDAFENKIVGYTMQINFSFLESLIPNIHEIYFNISETKSNQKISKFMILIYQYYIGQNPARYIKIYSLTLEIISVLIEECQTKRIFTSTKKTKEIIKYVHDHYQENLLLYNVADYFGFSREYFSRFFKKEIGFSFKQYLTNYRINQSLFLLENTSKNIIEISFELGFSSETQFINNFKKIYKITPGQYKKSLFEYNNVNKLI